jgi:hypothetical protein
MGTCQEGKCEGPEYSAHNGLVNIYLISLWTVGGSAWLIFTTFRNHGWQACNSLIILPIIAWIATLAFIILDINLVLYQTSITPSNSIKIQTTQWVLDCPSAVALHFAYYFRLQVALQPAKEMKNAPPFLDRLSRAFLVVPISWPVYNTLAICYLWIPELQTWARGHFLNIVVGVWNIGSAVYSIFMHCGFVWVVIRMIGDNPLRKRLKATLIIIAAVLVFNPFGLLMGSIWSFWDLPTGTVIIYSTWLNEVLVYLLLNITITHGLAQLQKPENFVDPAEKLGELVLGGS